MNFFAYQERARSSTYKLYLLFVLAVIGVIGGIGLVFALALSEVPEARGPVVMFTSALVLLIVLGASTYKSLSLRQGGGAVAASLGGVAVNHDARDFHYRRLVNVVEEMAIAAGMPCPEIYVLEQEDAINAFAAGFSSSDAAVAVTRGALMKLSRDELQGVIAHEFSHILNGDMRINLRLTGLVFGLMAVGWLGQQMLRVTDTGTSKRDGAPLLAIGLGVFVLGYLGMFFGRLIKANISRNREYLADASAVQFSRQTDGLAGALKKVGGFQAGALIGNQNCEQVEHMLFAEGLGLSKMMATHPDLGDRIKRLDSSFNASEFNQLARAETAFTNWHADEEPPSVASLLGKSQPNRASNITPQNLVARVARPEAPHVDYAQNVRKGIDKNLRNAAHDREHTIELLLVLVMHADANLQLQQLARIDAELGLQRGNGVRALLPLALVMAPEYRLPLACMAFPNCKLRSQSELARVNTVLNDLIRIDGQVDVFEYALVRMFERYIDEAFAPHTAKAMGGLKLADCAQEIQQLFSVLAGLGHGDATQAQRAFSMAFNEALSQQVAAYTPISNWAAALDRALPKLDRLQPFAKRQLIAAMGTCVQFDGQLRVAEAEVLRALCALLHCPLPPILEAQDLAAV